MHLYEERQSFEIKCGILHVYKERERESEFSLEKCYNFKYVFISFSLSNLIGQLK